jgi:hypothetical protein
MEHVNSKSVVTTLGATLFLLSIAPSYYLDFYNTGAEMWYLIAIPALSLAGMKTTCWCNWECEGRLTFEETAFRKDKRSARCQLGWTFFLAIVLVAGSGAQFIFTLGSDSFGVNGCMAPDLEEGITREQWIQYFRKHQPGGVVLVDSIKKLNKTAEYRVADALAELYGAKLEPSPMSIPGCDFMCKRCLDFESPCREPVKLSFLLFTKFGLQEGSRVVMEFDDDSWMMAASPIATIEVLAPNKPRGSPTIVAQWVKEELTLLLDVKGGSVGMYSEFKIVLTLGNDHWINVPLEHAESSLYAPTETAPWLIPGFMDETNVTCKCTDTCDGTGQYPGIDGRMKPVIFEARDGFCDDGITSKGSVDYKDRAGNCAPGTDCTDCGPSDRPFALSSQQAKLVSLQRCNFDYSVLDIKEVLMPIPRPTIGRYTVLDPYMTPTEYETPLESSAVFTTGTEQYCFTLFPVAYNLFVAVQTLIVATVAIAMAIKDWWIIERRRFVHYPIDVETSLAVRRAKGERVAKMMVQTLTAQGGEL